MAINCPYCQHGIAVKGLKPGRFAPKCPKCQKAFRLTVADDAENTMTVAAIPGAQESTAAPAKANKSDATVPSKSAPPMDATMARPNRPPPPPSTPAPPAPAAKPATKPPSQPVGNDATVAQPPRKTSPPPAAAATAPPRPASRPPAAAADVTAPSSGGARSSRAAVAAPAPALEDDGQSAGILTGTLGGYELVKRLGQGGMGAVYLARQISLDRNVALKTMNPEWASDANFVARFTREAYAAAQLNHHNVVQIYDIGAQNETNFFSMEFVDGRSLGDLMREKGRLDPEEAAGYILQAARGLKFAHDQGMVHRDIKPDNLMINKQGIVKVADLGLVKTPAAVAAEDEAARVPTGSALGSASGGSGTTGASAIPTLNTGKPSGKSGSASLLSKSAASSATLVDVAMGTPAYMAPEQARNATGVDQRAADIYSLGCTLYVLVTGRPVFEGDSAVEVMSKHATEQMTPPELIVERVPHALSAIVQKMTAKLPQDRYQTMDEVIKVMEEFLGISSAGPFTPREEHARTLEDGVKAFNVSKPAKMRRQMIWGFYALCGLVALLLVLTRNLTAVWWAGGIVGLAILATLCYLTVVGITQKTFLFAKVRQWVFGAGWKDWAMSVGGLILLVVILHIFSLLWIWLGFFILAAGLAVGFALVIDRKVAKDRQGTVHQVEEMLKGMRLRGLEEQALRQFVCKYSGEVWEEFYEALFDYEAKLKARELWGKGDRGRARKKFAAWRDTIINALERRIQQRKELREKKYLQKVAEKELKAKGVSDADAKKQSEESAETMVAKAAEFKEQAAHYAADMATMPAGSASGGRRPLPTFTAGSLLATDDNAAKTRERHRRAAHARGPALMRLLFGPFTRFVVGAILIAACGLWIKNNALGSGGEVPQFMQTHQFSSLATILDPTHNDFKPLEVPFVPQSLADKLLNSLNVGVAGLILFLSAFLGRLKLAIFVVPAAAIAWLGLLAPIPPVAGLNPSVVAMAAGGVLALLGFVVARK